MRKNFVLFAILANLFLVLACSQEQPSKEQLIGTWKHPISVGSVNVNNESTTVYNYEIFKFKGDGTFVFGEYGQSPLYEVEGRWELTEDKQRLVVTAIRITQIMCLKCMILFIMILLVIDK